MFIRFCSFFIIGLILCSNALAGEFRQFKNKMFEQLSLLTPSNRLVKIYYKKKNEQGLEKILKEIRQNNKGYFEAKHQEFIDSDRVSKFVFEKINWEPEFCFSFKSVQDDLKQCQSAFLKFIAPIDNIKLNKRHLLYLNGNDNGNFFKKVFIIGHDTRFQEFIITELSILDEQ